MTWKLDALSTLGVGCAFLLNLILIRTPLAFVCPFVDPGIAIILAIVLIKEPIEMILDSLRSLVLFAPDEEIKEKLQTICADVLKKYGCELTYIDIIKTGRKIWSEVYFLPVGNTVDLSRLKEMNRELTERSEGEFDSIYIELIPDIEEYHVLPPEEVTARRNELIRYLSNKQERRSAKSFL